MDSEIAKNLILTRSLLTLIFDENELARLLNDIEFCEAIAGEVIIHEGDKSETCFIPLSGELDLYTDSNGASLTNGRVQIGRTVNTYALLRSRPYQYSAKFNGPATYARLPASIIHASLERKPRVSKYLHLITESQDFRVLSKDIDSLGCSSAFKIELISRLRPREYAPQEWLQSTDVPQEAYYLVEGQLVNQRVGEERAGSVNQWQVPSRTWLCWRQLLEQTAHSSVIKSITSSKVLTLAHSDLLDLKKLFPDDIQAYSQSILSGREYSEPEEIDGEDIDLNELARQTRKRKHFWQSYPWVQQNDAMDCGPACLAMISVYYDRKVPIQFWREQLSTNREGTSLFDLAKTSERCGFTSYALAITDLNELDRTFFPIIALRKYHYLVVYKVTEKWVIVGDPGLGIRRMSREEFYDGFEKAVLFLRPTESFLTLPEATKPYKHFIGLLDGLQREISVNFIVSLMIVSLGLLTPVISQIFMDDILVKRDIDLFKLTLAGAALVAFLDGFLKWTRNYYSNYLATKFEFRAHSVFVKKMVSLSYRFFAERHVGDFTRRLSEISKIRQFMLNSVESMVLSVLSLVIYTVALSLYSPRIAIAVFAATPVFFLMAWFGGRKLSGLYQEIFKESAELESSITDTVRGIASLKALGAELASRWRYEEKFVRFLKAERKFSLASSSISVFADFYSHLVNSMIMGLAAYMAIKGDLSPGQVVAVTMIASNVLTPITSLAGRFGEIQELFSVCNRLNDVLLAPSEKSSNKGRVRKEALLGEIEFRDVWFRYGGESADWVLKGVSFKIEAGSNVAFVGPSGSGKSTVASLITRMYEPTRGQIFIDGRDYLDYDVEWLRTQLGVLHQESCLFEGSILENIGFSEPEVDYGRVQLAAQKAAAEEFILKKSNGYASHISPGGLGLSGGEKQRIAIARMFYRDPKIMILDEATSALDGIAESELLLNLKGSTTRLTTINIAHRYSTVKFSDYALVLFEGKVKGFGTHEQLQQENEIYQKLFSPQLESMPLNVRRVA